MLDPSWGRASYLFNATIAGIEKADALLLVGANPRREAAVLNARIRKRWSKGGFPIGLIGERADLTYPYDYLGAGPETLDDVAVEPQRVRLDPQERRASAGDRRHGCAGAAGRACDRLACCQARAQRAGTTGTAIRCCIRRQRGSAPSTSALFPGPAVAMRAQMAAPAALDVLFLLGADEIDIAPGAFVVYIGTSRRPRRAPRRRHPAGRGLSGEVRHLRQFGRARADVRPRLVPAGRGARGLGHPARVVGCARPSAALRFARRVAPKHCSRRIPICSASTASRPATGRTLLRSRRGAERRRSGRCWVRDRRLLSHQSDRAGVRRDGGMLGDRRGPRRALRGGVEGS